MGGALVFRADKVDYTFVDFDTRVDTAALQLLGEWNAILGLLVKSFVEQDDSRDVLVDGIRCSEKQLERSASD